MPESTRYLSTQLIQQLSREIEEAGGTEIFAVLSRGEGDDLFNEATVVCRGTHSEVPALLSRTKPGDMTLHNHPSGVLQASQADMHMATIFGEEGVGSMIVNNSVTLCRVVVEPSTEPKAVPIDLTSVEKVFEVDGPLSKKLPGYEPREGQKQMSGKIGEALNEGRILAVEAGTGTGKSLAYLVPSLLWTRENKGRVVIATKTIALQEQLVFKDIPLAREVIRDAPQASLVKGRNNYVCLRRMRDLESNQMELFEAEEGSMRRELEDLTAWVNETGSGDRADLPFVPTREAWDMVRSDSDMCMGSKCPHFQQSPFYESRRRAARAKVLVVNQALLFSDLALRSASGNYQAGAVIPPYQHVILDEAHSIEDIATDHFGDRISSLGLRMTLSKFLAPKGNKGLLHRLFQAALETETFDLSNYMQDDSIPRFRLLSDEVSGQLHALSAALHQIFNPDQRKQVVVWLKEEVLASQELEEARDEAKALLACLHQLGVVLRKLRDHTQNQPARFETKTEGLRIELDARISRLETTMAALKNFAISPGENQVPWLELKKGRQYDEFDYRVSPLDVSPMLREALFKPFKSVVMTSATLDLNDRFGFLSARNGLQAMEEREWFFQKFPSPFDYAAQARLLLTRLPSEPHHSGFLDHLTELILRTVFSGMPGGTLVLFTSYQLLYAIAGRIEGPLSRAGVDLLVQGRANRSFLIDRLKKSQGVLLGTDSFWEGVDLPGQALTKVIVTKLPFRQVKDPIFEARCAALENKGKSSFKELSLPLALLKFKQGIGRLIRHKNDTGVLIVADNRIRSKGYGRKFLSLADGYPIWDLDLAGLSDQLKAGSELP